MNNTRTNSNNNKDNANDSRNDNNNYGPKKEAAGPSSSTTRSRSPEAMKPPGDA